MSMISYDEYLNALEKTNIFHQQLEEKGKDDSTSNAYLDMIRDVSILELLHKYATKRLVNSIRLFLESEKCDGKMPFAFVEEVTVVFFIEKYTLNKLKRIWNLGPRSLVLLDKILQDVGYKIRQQ